MGNRLQAPRLFSLKFMLMNRFWIRCWLLCEKSIFFFHAFEWESMDLRLFSLEFMLITDFLTCLLATFWISILSMRCNGKIPTFYYSHLNLCLYIDFLSCFLSSLWKNRFSSCVWKVSGYYSFFTLVSEKLIFKFFF